MPKAKDYTDQKFNNLTAMFYTGKVNSNNCRIWHFRCDCGNECDKTIAQVKNGNVKSCGCLPKFNHNEIDWSKRKLNFLTPIKKADNVFGKSHKKMWLFKCDCDNFCEFPIAYVSDGRIISCGCIVKPHGNTGKKINSKSILKDYAGLKFNMLTALYRISSVEEVNQKNDVWKFRCDCGNEFDCKISDVSRKNFPKKSCGCVNKTSAIDYSNKKFNMLTLVIPTNKRIGSMIVWKCKCDCGNECEIAGSLVASGLTKSCGCLKGKFSGEMSVAHDAYQGYVKRDKKNFGVDLAISFDQFLILAKDICHYCKRLPHRIRRKGTKKFRNTHKFVYNGVDRKNSELPHTVENCVTCCWTCNKMKSNMGYYEFIDHIKLIYENVKELNVENFLL